MPSVVDLVSSPHLAAMPPSTTTTTITTTIITTIPSLAQEITPVKKNRCPVDGCKRRLMLTDFACRCGKTCCPSHRFADDHACTYDFKKDAKDVLLKTMSTAVVGVKVEKI
jgi:hypothetical protein